MRDIQYLIQKFVIIHVIQNSLSSFGIVKVIYLFTYWTFFGNLLTLFYIILWLFNL